MFGDHNSIDNAGINSGVMVGTNTGNIVISCQNVKKMPSLISKVVKLLGDACVADTCSANLKSLKDFRPDEKITYNNVKKYRYIISEYASYYALCDEYMNLYDDSNINSKSRILACVHLWYLTAKGDVISQNQADNKTEIEIVREYSDSIIDMVNMRIMNAVKESEEIESMQLEELELGVACILCYCFMECKILEKPA